MSTQDHFQGIPVIHWGNASFATNDTYDVITIGADASNTGFARTFPLDANSATGFGLFVPSLGLYTRHLIHHRVSLSTSDEDPPRSLGMRHWRHYLCQMTK
jgi:hypothetical protein